MVRLVSLWVPIIVSAVLVFFVSSVIHMLLRFHRSDWRKVPSEEDVMEALKRFKLPPGDYLLPRPDRPARKNSAKFKAKRQKGPRLLMTVLPHAETPVRNLVLWFLYSMVVASLAGYVAGIVLSPGTPRLIVFRITATVAFTGFALALWQNSIWHARGWGATIRSTIDGLVYGLLTGAVFSWLWP